MTVTLTYREIKVGLQSIQHRLSDETNNNIIEICGNIEHLKSEFNDAIARLSRSYYQQLDDLIVENITLLSLILETHCTISEFNQFQTPLQEIINTVQRAVLTTEAIQRRRIISTLAKLQNLYAQRTTLNETLEIKINSQEARLRGIYDDLLEAVA